MDLVKPKRSLKVYHSESSAESITAVYLTDKNTQPVSSACPSNSLYICVGAMISLSVCESACRRVSESIRPTNNQHNNES